MSKTARLANRSPYQKILAKVARFLYLAEDAAGDLPADPKTDELYERLRGLHRIVGRELHAKKGVDADGNRA